MFNLNEWKKRFEKDKASYEEEQKGRKARLLKAIKDGFNIGDKEYEEPMKEGMDELSWKKDN